MLKKIEDRVRAWVLASFNDDGPVEIATWKVLGFGRGLVQIKLGFAGDNLAAIKSAQEMADEELRTELKDLADFRQGPNRKKKSNANTRFAHADVTWVVEALKKTESLGKIATILEGVSHADLDVIRKKITKPMDKVLRVVAKEGAEGSWALSGPQGKQGAFRVTVVYEGLSQPLLKGMAGSVVTSLSGVLKMAGYEVKVVDLSGAEEVPAHVAVEAR